MAARLNLDPNKMMATLKSTVFQKASDEEMAALVVVANEYDLNPFLKEIYAFPAKGGGIVPIVSVDGWNKMLIRQQDFDGIEFDFTDDESGNPVACTATVYTKSRSKPVKVTEYFAECKRNTDPWNSMPRRMLRNRTLCQAARMAFGFSGVTSHDEAADYIDVSVAQATPTEPLPRVLPVASQSSVTPQVELATLVTDAGFTFDQFRAWGIDQQGLNDSVGSFDEVPADLAKRLVKAKVGLLGSLKAANP